MTRVAAWDLRDGPDIEGEQNEQADGQEARAWIVTRSPTGRGGRHPNSSVSRVTVELVLLDEAEHGSAFQARPEPTAGVARCQHHPRRMREQGERLRDVGAVAVREQHVEQHQVRLEVACRVQGGRRRTGLGNDVVAAALEQQSGHPTEAGMVIDKEHRAGHA